MTTELRWTQSAFQTKWILPFGTSCLAKDVRRSGFYVKAFDFEFQWLAFKLHEHFLEAKHYCNEAFTILKARAFRCLRNQRILEDIGLKKGNACACFCSWPNEQHDLLLRWVRTCTYSVSLKGVLQTGIKYFCLKRKISFWSSAASSKWNKCEWTQENTASLKACCSIEASFWKEQECCILEILILVHG